MSAAPGPTAQRLRSAAPAAVPPHRSDRLSLTLDARHAAETFCMVRSPPSSMSPSCSRRRWRRWADGRARADAVVHYVFARRAMARNACAVELFGSTPMHSQCVDSLRSSSCSKPSTLAVKLGRAIAVRRTMRRVFLDTPSPPRNGVSCFTTPPPRERRRRRRLRRDSGCAFQTDIIAATTLAHIVIVSPTAVEDDVPPSEPRGSRNWRQKGADEPAALGVTRSINSR